MMEKEDIKKPIDITVTILTETDRAFRVTDNDNPEFGQWIPKSQIFIEQDAGVGDTIIITMPEWLAIDKGFI